MLEDGFPNADCEAGALGAGGRVVTVVGGATRCTNVVGGGGGGGGSVVGGAATCFVGMVVDDGTVVEGAAKVGGVTRTGCAPFCTV
jgi:hypothetical protein